MFPPRYVIIANPDSLRLRAYVPALADYWAARGITPDVEVVSWRDVVGRDGNLDGLAAFDRPAVVRLESPGRDWEVTRLLLAAGARRAGEDCCGTVSRPCHDWLALPYRKGWLVRPGLFYAGFRRVLEGLHAGFAARPHLRPTADPLEVAEMFDKNATCARLARA